MVCAGEHAERQWGLMTFPSDIVLRTLVALEAELVHFRGYARQLEAANGTGDFQRSLAAATGVRRVFDSLAAVYTRLRTHVVAFDGAVMGDTGDTVGSFGELAIRAEMGVVAAELSQLVDAMDADAMAVESSQRASSSEYAGVLLGEAPPSIDEIWGSIREEFEHINRTWLPYRKTGEPSSERYHDAIRDAQQAVIAIGQTPDVARFLRAGTTCTRWPAVRAACLRVTLAFQISLEVEPYLSLLRRPLIEVPLEAFAGVPLRKR